MTADRLDLDAQLSLVTRTAANGLDEIHRLRAELETAQAALARVTDEAMNERIEDALASHFEQEVHAAYAARATIEAIRAVAGEGQEAGGQ